jgi:hypothetical protein
MELKKNFDSFRRPPVAPTTTSASVNSMNASRRHRVATAELHSYSEYKSWVRKIRDEWPAPK